MYKIITSCVKRTCFSLQTQHGVKYDVIHSKMWKNLNIWCCSSFFYMAGKKEPLGFSSALFFFFLGFFTSPFPPPPLPYAGGYGPSCALLWVDPVNSKSSSSEYSNSGPCLPRPCAVVGINGCERKAEKITELCMQKSRRWENDIVIQCVVQKSIHIAYTACTILARKWKTPYLQVPARS